MYKTLKQYFGYDDFRLNQSDIISSINNNKNTLAILPTGGGKSLCFQIPALMKSGLTIVISPLISLMKDQVRELKDINVRAAYLNSTTELEEAKDVFKDIANGSLKLLYMSPEKLVEQNFIEYLLERNVDISCIAVDEAHCISMWGNEFRPQYKELKNLFKRYSEIPIIALTATANLETISDIQEICNIKSEDTYTNSFDRSNIKYSITNKKTDGFAQVKKIVKEHVRRKETGIIYCFTRKDAERISKKLNLDRLIKAEPYHAGLELSDKNRVQEMFINDDINVVVATVAFGMGINKSNVRYIIHNSIPFSIENYYQETGRGGRDGLDVSTTLLFSWSDVVKISMMLKDSKDKSQMQKFTKMIDYVLSNVCRRKTLLKYFADNYENDNCGNCDICSGDTIIVKDAKTKEVSLAICKVIEETNQNLGLQSIAELLTIIDKKKQLTRFKGKSFYELYRGVYSKDELVHFIRELIYLGYLYEYRERGSNISSIKVIDKALTDIIYKNEGILLTTISFLSNSKATANNRIVDLAVKHSSKKVDLVVKQDDEVAVVENKLSLYDELEEFRTNKSIAVGIESNMIITNNDFNKIIDNIPKSKLDLNRLKIRVNTVKFYGSDIIKICKNF